MLDERRQEMKKTLIPVAIAAVTLLAACGNDADGASSGSDGGGESDLSGQQLVVVNWGGSSGEAMQKGWIDPFSEDTGAQIVMDSPPDQAKVKAMVDAGNTTWDIVDFGAATGAAECGKLFDERPADFDISDIDPKFVTDDCGVPSFVAPVQVVYNKELYGDNPPTSVEDFLDVEKFPGKRIFLNWADGQVEPLLMTAGVPADEVYPIDWSKVEEATAKLGDEMTPQDTITAATQSLESGDYGMCLCYAGSMQIAESNGAEFGVIWDKVFAAWDVLYAVKGSKSPEAQWAFMQHVATQEGQAPFYEYSAYSSPLKDAPEVPEEMQPYVLSSHEDEISETYTYDPGWWAENNDAAIAEWTRIMAG
jgi:putative spermidine/putrescine transport system substrate-binding protein